MLCISKIYDLFNYRLHRFYRFHSENYWDASILFYRYAEARKNLYKLVACDL